MNEWQQELYEVPTYGMPEAAKYLRVPYQTLRYWITGFHRMPPIISPASSDPIRLSFINLLEGHMLTAMRKAYNLRLPKVRKALETMKADYEFSHPLVEQVFQTDGADLFIHSFDSLINVSRGGQLAIKDLLELHLQRIERDSSGVFKFFPFVMERSPNEPKFILIDPHVCFGKPVITGTGISTALIASRFDARESIPDLAEEYDCSIQQIEEAVRWEQARPIAA